MVDIPNAPFHFTIVVLIDPRSCTDTLSCRPSFVDVPVVYVTAKVKVLQKCAAFVVGWVVATWERQLDWLCREGLRPRASVNSEGDRAQ